MWWCWCRSFWGGPWCWCRDFWGGRWWCWCSSATWKMSILPQFWTSDTHKVTRGLPPAASKFAFYHSFERPTPTKWRKGRSASLKICILPQFWASDTHEVTRGSLGQSKHLHFTTVLSVRHARSDETVDRTREKFAFYQSFERPTRTKWRAGCQIHRCDPCAQTEKRIYFNNFSEDFDYMSFSAVFSLVLFSSLFQRILISSLSLQSFL